MTDLSVAPTERSLKYFTLSASLKQQSAELKTVSFQNYTMLGLRILRFASANGFNTTDTKLVVNKQAIAIPKLSSPANEVFSDQLSINMTQPKIGALTEDAAKAGITQSERVRRALRFANFLSTHNALYTATFEHAGTNSITIVAN